MELHMLSYSGILLGPLCANCTCAVCHLVVEAIISLVVLQTDLQLLDMKLIYESPTGQCGPDAEWRYITSQTDF